VQLLRTYGVKHPPFPFAPAGERSIARAYTKAFALARSLIYIEDQYMWSAEVAAGIAHALQRNPSLNLIVVVPRYPSSNGPVAGPPSRIGQLRALRMLHRAAPGRVGVFDLENSDGTPIYLHAKICIVDDTWVTCGSDNFTRRSWTTDSELTCAVIDGDAAGGLARQLRIRLWAEHLELDEDDPRLLDPAAGLRLWNSTAAALEGWHGAGRDSRRPAGRVRHHTTQAVTRLQRLWADPVNRIVVDPDGRPRELRGTDEF
jgi:phosphatidylserine/phosphatidylglycerophosphate/cardiolipin synthase-like enzyme